MGFVNIILRGTALLWTLIITALIGNVIASNVNASTSAESAVNFTMFVAVWSWLAGLIGLAASFVPAVAMLFLDVFAVLFTFIDAIVLAAKLRAVNCGNIRNDHLPHNWIAFGSHDDEKRCREIQASTAFMWFLWATFCGCLFFTFREFRSGGVGHSFRSSRPSMSQVGV